ncbi:MAG: hypothetical protein EOO45_10240 [Flavobacterium sp.]|nr:MAG: hypothetical protein EOO45_10240 [Flavobacterium sp.]
MKLKTVFIALFFTLFFSTAAFAQMDRTIGREQYKRSKGKNGKEKQDFVIITAQYYAAELKLDDFQAAAVREIIEKERDAIMTLSEDKDATELERKDRGREIADKIEANMKPLLSNDQLEKFALLREKRKKS